ncbi:alkyl/aryl-sulfatase [Nocardia jejuensis]|uniref:alkyl/aryl-sulfatase n=1 Tax=Nocardia jejuensis TaxID=328049 RepID=UPI0014725410|nr:alkyl sulfatase dimerization domain-containing protein [Nocardia jejuensis]
MTKTPTAQTAEHNMAAFEQLPFEDRRDYADVRRGWIAPLPPGSISDASGAAVWDLRRFLFPQSWPSAPASVHPSLWRQGQLMGVAGLFEVVPGIYQVRNHDLANVTFVETADSVVVIDTGSNADCAAAALRLYHEHRPLKRIAAVIYTGTHTCHHGGVLGLISPRDVARDRVSIIAPGQGFQEAVLGTDIAVSTVASRREGYFRGAALPVNERGFVSGGITTAPFAGPWGYLAPTDLIRTTGEQRVIGGVRFEFMPVPGTESSRALHVWIPEYETLCCAENANHSLCDIRQHGPQPCDIGLLVHRLDETLARYGRTAEVHFGTHTWPVWGNRQIREFLASQRDAYKYIRDETLRLANHGLPPAEIAARIRFPDSLARSWWNRGYHGALAHDARAVYAHELGWYDGNPASLAQHPATTTAPRYVHAMGGGTAVLRLAQSAFDSGDYRWAVELLAHLLSDQPAHVAARRLQADAYEQLGYQSEEPQRRNAFLTATQELRSGVIAPASEQVPLESMLELPLRMLFDHTAIRLNGPRAALASARFDLRITDRPGPHGLEVSNGVLYYRTSVSVEPDAVITLAHHTLVTLLAHPELLESLCGSGALHVEGDVLAWREFLRNLDHFDPGFAVVTPRADGSA